jgi:hypothetical protein
MRKISIARMSPTTPTIRKEKGRWCQTNIRKRLLLFEWPYSLDNISGIVSGARREKYTHKYIGIGSEKNFSYVQAFRWKGDVNEAKERMKALRHQYQFNIVDV